MGCSITPHLRDRSQRHQHLQATKQRQLCLMEPDVNHRRKDFPLCPAVESAVCCPPQEQNGPGKPPHLSSPSLSSELSDTPVTLLPQEIQKGITAMSSESP